MKKFKFLLALILIGAVCFSCKKTEQEPNINSTDRTAIQNPALDVEKVNQRINARLASLRVYQEQLAQAGNSNRECMDRVVVPDDASTIQDAIEMVCEYGEVIVQSGTYAESIWIFNKPGIHIRAVGNVILNGGFALEGNSDNVIIEGFHIVVPDYPFIGDAVWMYYVSGCVIKNNIISNQAYPGIESEDYGITIWESGNDNQIKLNHVSNCDLDGISMTGAFDNMIGPNNICNYNGRDGISLWPDTGDNRVINNEALHNTGFDIWNGGVNNKFKANTAVTTFGL